MSNKRVSEINSSSWFYFDLTHKIILSIPNTIQFILSISVVVIVTVKVTY